MFMTTTFAHYQLPVLQAASVGATTESGADRPGPLARPLGEVGPRSELPVTQIVRPREKATLPFEFHQWLERLQGYEQGAVLGKGPRNATEAIAERREIAESEAAPIPAAANDAKAEPVEARKEAAPAPQAEPQAAPQPDSER